jgi:hypothetical protein
LVGDGGCQSILTQINTDARGCTQMIRASRRLSGQFIGRAFTVPTALGAGFREKVYESVSSLKLLAVGLMVVQ